MKIICLKGGLGNQLFEYCRYCQTKERERTYLHLDRRRLKQHAGALISDCFEVTLPHTPIWVDAAVWGMKLLRRIGICKRLYDDERPDCLLIDDYCQHRDYITRAKEVLHFRPLDLPEGHKQLLQLIRQEAYPVAVHIRRGDYLHKSNLSNFGLCEVTYYHRAMEYIRQQHPAARFFFFSDDISWVKTHLHTEGAVYAEPLCGMDYADLYLMTECHGHIIANSTFSFWGAKLSTHPGIHIYPLRWYQNPTWTIPDIFPADWKGM